MCENTDFPAWTIPRQTNPGEKATYSAFIAASFVE